MIRILNNVQQSASYLAVQKVVTCVKAFFIRANVGVLIGMKKARMSVSVGII